MPCKGGSGCSGRWSGVIEPIRCGCCVDAELKGLCLAGSVDVVGRGEACERRGLAQGWGGAAPCGVPFLGATIYRAVMLMLMLFVDSRYCVTDLLLVGGDLGDPSL
jgi:hypothetical protein